MPASSIRATIYWIVYKVAHAVYSVFPVLGTIRGSVAVIRRDGGILVIDRNDRRGLGFPGGIANFKEPPEATLRREVREETGLAVESAELLFDFRTEKPFPVHTHVFEAVCRGEVKGSWEGTPTVVSLTDLQTRVIVEQKPIVEFLLARPSRAATGLISPPRSAG